MLIVVCVTFVFMQGLAEQKERNSYASIEGPGVAVIHFRLIRTFGPPVYFTFSFGKQQRYRTAQMCRPVGAFAVYVCIKSPLLLHLAQLL